MASQNQTSRGQRRPASDAVVPPESTRCQVIPVNDELPCSRSGTGYNPRVCDEHRLEHQRLYFAYKLASTEAKQLRAQIVGDPGSRRVGTLTEDALRSAIERREEYERVMNAEVERREQHRKRFDLEVDDGHAQWLETLQANRAKNAAALIDLRRRGTLLSAARAREEEEEEEERSRLAARLAAEEEQRREGEAAKRARTELARKHEEEAQRRRAIEAARVRRAAEEEAQRRRATAIEVARARRAAEEEAARKTARRESLRRAEQVERARQQELTNEVSRRIRDTQTLRAETGEQSAQQPLLSPLDPRHASAVPSYGPRTPQGAYPSTVDADLERQDAACSERRSRECSVLADIVVVLLVGACAFFAFVKLIG